MLESDFSIKTRRTSRVAVRIPLQIAVGNASGTVEEVTAWTVVVNEHGARCECSRTFELNQEVRITNLANREKATGRIVWCGGAPDPTGRYEFAVELQQPSNLWHINFPPADWKYGRDSKYVRDAADAASPAPPPQAPNTIAASESGTPPLRPDPVEENSQWESGLAVPSVPQSDVEKLRTDALAADVPALEKGEPAPPAPQPSNPAAPLLPVGSPDAFTELIESTLRSKIETEIGCAVLSMDRRLAAAQQISETHAVQLLDRSRELLNHALSSIAEAGEERSQRLREVSEEIVSAASRSLQDRIAVQAQTLEEEIVGRCKSESEHFSAEAIDRTRQVLSQELDEISEKLSLRQRALMESLDDREGQASRALEDTVNRLEAQMSQFAQAVIGSYARNLTQKVNARQRYLLLQAESKIGTALETSVREMRTGFARSLRELAAAMTDPEQVGTAVRETQAEFSRALTEPGEDDPNGAHAADAELPPAELRETAPQDGAAVGAELQQETPPDDPAEAFSGNHSEITL